MLGAFAPTQHPLPPDEGETLSMEKIYHPMIARRNRYDEGTFLRWRELPLADAISPPIAKSQTKPQLNAQTAVDRTLQISQDAPKTLKNNANNNKKQPMKNVWQEKPGARAQNSTPPQQLYSAAVKKNTNHDFDVSQVMSQMMTQWGQIPVHHSI
ncbi:hypothetical protein TNCV_4590611 [Trichonephila clavipes]|nr:hypothetical protein TNCV_4590611 [Trichonephila clavipes]